MSTEGGSRWERNTWPYLKQLAAEVPEAGIHFQSESLPERTPGRQTNHSSAENRLYRRREDITRLRDGSISMLNNVFAEEPWYRELVDDYRVLSDEELPGGIVSGAEFGSLCINPAVYLPWLLGRCRKNGVTFHRGVLGHVSEVQLLPGSGGKVDVVVNTTGLGSYRLGGVNDQSMTPIRGQTVVVRNVSPHMMCMSGTDYADDEACYMMTRASGGGTILGGTIQIGSWESQPDPNIANRIMRRAVKAMPELTGGKGVEYLDIVRHGVGLRPGRDGGVRLEKQRVGNYWVVHNYGHAGWGYQGSYGCAEEVVSLVESISFAAKL